ncbi:MAG: hypothetical protein KAR20_27600, partial [Candidatus Heimdallarchaeota archaeon]|nr:hypothetical protein [Candidatus Heimdallarchaeota archaeon]
SFIIGETVSVEGIVKGFKFEADVEDLDVDLVIIAKEIVRENGEVVTILTDAEIDAFMGTRQRDQMNDEVVEISVEVIKWEISEYTITVEGEDYSDTKTVEIALLLVRNVENENIILVKVNHHRSNTTLAEDFITVGDVITIKGVIRDEIFNSEHMLDILNIESEEMMMAISITNADGIEEILVSRNAFAQARQYGHFQLSGSRKGSLGRKRMI